MAREQDTPPEAEEAVSEGPKTPEGEVAPRAEETVTAPETEAEATPEPQAEPAKPGRRPRRGTAETAPGEEPVRPAGERPVVRARARYVRTSARKARLVCEHLRGKSVPEARAILAHTPRAAAESWSRLLESAVANAEHNHELIGDELVITTIAADEGPTLKRFRPRAQGRATRIRKRTSHLSIALTPKE